MYKLFVQFVVLTGAIAGLSYGSSRLWDGKPEGQTDSRALIVEPTMTVVQFGQRNDLPPTRLKKVFGLQVPADKQKPISAFGMNGEQIVKKTANEPPEA